MTFPLCERSKVGTARFLLGFCTPLRGYLIVQAAICASGVRENSGFVARDKRILATAAETSSLDTLIESLSGSDLAARAVEPQVRALSPGDTEQLFNALRERVLRASSFQTEPAGFTGLMLIAKNHPRHQSELLSLIESIDATTLGAWATRGWKEILTEPGTTERLNAVYADHTEGVEPAVRRAQAKTVNRDRW